MRCDDAGGQVLPAEVVPVLEREPTQQPADQFLDIDQLPTSLREDPALARSWQELAQRTQLARLGLHPCAVNADLERAAEAERAAPTAPPYRLWIADNYAWEGRWDEAIRACDGVLAEAEDADRLVPGVDLSHAALRRQAELAAAAGYVEQAVSSWRNFAASQGSSEQAAEAVLAAGLLTERAGTEDEAAALYASIAASEDAAEPSPQQLARRAVRRLDQHDEIVLPSAAACTALLVRALEDRDINALDNLATRSHFAVGFVGGHFGFEEASIRERLLAELATGPAPDRSVLRGTGSKRYLFCEGWDGRLLRGTIALVLTHGPRGWQWSGIALTAATDEWLARLAPAPDASNQPLPFTLRAPWPAGVRFMAGGFNEFAVKASAVLAAGPTGPLVALGFSQATCGFGPRGFYYNSRVSSTHQGSNAFAIDFTRYRRGVPFDNESGGTPVLAPAPGIVIRADAGRPSGDDSFSNTVEIVHRDPVTGADDRYLSRYLHLAGPFLLNVSVGMPVIVGQRLGLMNDTGNSVLDHLHFSIHDQTIAVPGSSRGTSLRPSPMDGVTLGDGDSETCVLSSNRERRPPPLDDAEFVEQQVPAKMQPLQKETVAVTMRNNGPTTWTAGYELTSLTRGWSLDEVPIGRSVEPDEDIRIEFGLLALSPGDFDFQWQMARPFTGRFGQPTPRRTVEVGEIGDPSTCARLNKALAAANQELSSWQDMLAVAPPGQKAQIIDQIRRLGAQIAALEAQKQRAACP
jgi:murein DD-endopeptidase MepM/ murein hydrolase activator NlpD